MPDPTWDYSAENPLVGWGGRFEVGQSVISAKFHLLSTYFPNSQQGLISMNGGTVTKHSWGQSTQKSIFYKHS